MGGRFLIGYPLLQPMNPGSGPPIWGKTLTQQKNLILARSRSWVRSSTGRGGTLGLIDHYGPLFRTYDATPEWQRARSTEVCRHITD